MADRELEQILERDVAELRATATVTRFVLEQLVQAAIAARPLLERHADELRAYGTPANVARVAAVIDDLDVALGGAQELA